MPAAAAANRPIGKASPLVPTYANADTPAAASAPAQAAASSSAPVSRSSPACTTASSPRPAATMSSRSSRFMRRAPAASVGRRQRLGALDQQRPAVDREGALAGAGAQQLEPELLVGVALAQEGPL